MAMCKWLRWAFWNSWYVLKRCIQPKRDRIPLGELKTLMRQFERCRWPWWKFKPHMYHNDEGKFWEICFEPEMDCMWYETIEVRALRACDQDNRIVGLKIPDRALAPVDTRELIRREQARPRTGPAPRLIFISLRNADDTAVEAKAFISHNGQELERGLWAVRHEDSECTEIMSAGEMPDHWREQLRKANQLGEQIRE